MGIYISSSAHAYGAYIFRQEFSAVRRGKVKKQTFPVLSAKCLVLFGLLVGIHCV